MSSWAFVAKLYIIAIGKNILFMVLKFSVHKFQSSRVPEIATHYQFNCGFCIWFLLILTVPSSQLVFES